MSCTACRSRQRVLNKSKGFTLLEVIVALGIVSVGILAISQAMVGYVNTVTASEQRMIALWVAANRLESLRIEKTDPVAGEVQGTEVMGGRSWHLREKTTATADPSLFRLDIRVFSDEAEKDEAGSLFGYLLKQ